MDRRLEMQHKLEQVFQEVTSINPITPVRRVWFQPPKSILLQYPCILYKLVDMPPRRANNLPYTIDHEYEMTVIDRDPTSTLREKIAELFVCRLVRIFESDGLHHYVFHIYD